jgi:hypothetical protein
MAYGFELGTTGSSSQLSFAKHVAAFNSNTPILLGEHRPAGLEIRN